MKNRISQFISIEYLKQFQFPLFFISIYIGLAFSHFFNSDIPQLLGSFHQKMIGIATLENYDANYRITLLS